MRPDHGGSVAIEFQEACSVLTSYLCLPEPLHRRVRKSKPSHVAKITEAAVPYIYFLTGLSVGLFPFF